MAKDLVRTRKQKQKMMMMHTQIQAVSLKIQSLKSVDTMANAMKGVTKVRSYGRREREREREGLLRSERRHWGAGREIEERGIEQERGCKRTSGQMHRSSGIVRGTSRPLWLRHDEMHRSKTA